MKINRILADFYIPRLFNDMTITVQKNHLGGKILYRSVYPAKTNDVNINFRPTKKIFPIQIIYSLWLVLPHSESFLTNGWKNPNNSKL